MSGSGYRVGVLGATGAVGSTILEILAERNFPASEVIAFASERSAGKLVPFGDGELTCVVPDDRSIQGIHILISSAGGSVSAEWAPKFSEAGAVVVDNTSYWRMHEDVPLVVAEVNPEAAQNHKGIIANPNCTTMVMMLVLAPIHREAGLERLIISSYQAVSGTGQKAIAELTEQAGQVLNGEEIDDPKVYPHQIAFNVIPQVETFKDGDDYTTEERKVMAETRKILGLGEEVKISATCARVPVFTGHSESLNIETREDLSPDRAREILSAAENVKVVDNPALGEYPTAIDAAGTDETLVGRIRRDPGQEKTLNLWLAGDNLRKGAATNAVQVAELLVSNGWLK
ncbi:MAG: aspartate-semialdehyde dehydrogenase [Solirubrobacterales bacterium]|nr:aspartate-semialdehyde dehydrogenase [Solirubrobacterales bacterium]HMT05851.1 aspartate-semialdehyde dehydrogenase [Solirubrobacterales bacterium]